MSSDGSGQHSDRDNHETDSRHDSSEVSHTTRPNSGIINPGFNDSDRHGQDLIQTRHLPTGVSAPVSDLPDILNSTLPPYTSPDHTLTRQGVHGVGDRGHVRRSFGRRPQVASRQRERDIRHPRDLYVLEDDLEDLCDKNCCTACLTLSTQFKWILVLLAIVGLCCVVTGIILGALHMTGSSFLTLSLMFIGLGVMLVVVVIIGWRCTPAGHEPCHLLFNLGEYSHLNRRQSGRRRRRTSNGRDRLNNWSGGVIYGDHRRPPPPSYAASMHDYERQSTVHQQPNPDSLPNSPPPTYKSQASLQRPGIHITFPHITGGDYPSSRPPTYRSHHSNVITHSRQISFQDSELPVSSAENGQEAVENTNGASSTTGTMRSTASSMSGAPSNTGSMPNRGILKQMHNSPPEQESNATTGEQGSDSNRSEITVSVVDTEPQGRGSPSGTREGNSMLQYAGHYGTAERNAVECLENILDTTMRDMNVQYQAGTLRPGPQGVKRCDVQSTNGASNTSREQETQRPGPSTSYGGDNSRVRVDERSKASSGPLGVRVDGHIRQLSGPAKIRHGVSPIHSSTPPVSDSQHGHTSSQTLPRGDRQGLQSSGRADSAVSGANLHPKDTMVQSSTLPAKGKRSVDSEVLRSSRSPYGTSLVDSVQVAAARGEHLRQCSDPVRSDQGTRTPRVAAPLAENSQQNYEKDYGKLQDTTIGVIHVSDSAKEKDSRREKGLVRVNSTSGQSAL